MRALGIAGPILFFGGIALGASDTSLLGGILLALIGLALMLITAVVFRVRSLWRSGLELYAVARGGRPTSVAVDRVELPKPLSVITGPAISMDVRVTNATGEHALSRDVPVPRLVALGLLPNALIARVFPRLDVRRLIRRDAEAAADPAPE